MKREQSKDNLTISNAVIASYAGNVAVKCFGIIKMSVASVSDGIGRILRKDKLRNGISVRNLSNGRLELDFHVVVSYGVNVKTVLENLTTDVKYEVEKYVGKEIEKINLYVEDVYRID